MAVLIEPVLHLLITDFLPEITLFSYFPVTLISAVVMVIFTVWSGIVYIKSYWKYVDSGK